MASHSHMPKLYLLCPWVVRRVLLPFSWPRSRSRSRTIYFSNISRTVGNLSDIIHYADDVGLPHAIETTTMAEPYSRIFVWLEKLTEPAVSFHFMPFCLWGRLHAPTYWMPIKASPIARVRAPRWDRKGATFARVEKLRSASKSFTFRAVTNFKLPQVAKYRVTVTANVVFPRKDPI